jgi:hypothetical protein
MNVHNPRTAADLVPKPMFAERLEEGLSQFDCLCEEFEKDRL